MSTHRFYSLYHTKGFFSYLLEKTLFGGVGILIWILCGGFAIFGAVILERYVFGAVLMFWILFVYVALRNFVFYKLRREQEPPLLEANIVGYFDYDLVSQLAPVVMSKTTELTIFRAALQSQRGIFLIHKLGVSPEHVLQIAESFFEESSSKEALQDIYQALYRVMEALEESRIGGHIVIWVYLKRFPVFEHLLNSLDISWEDITKAIEWESLHYHNALQIEAFSPEGIRKTMGSIGRTWTIGYTNDLDRITEDITEQIQYQEPHRVIIHRDVIQTTLATIAKHARNNVLLVGGVGVGKSTVIVNLAKYIRTFQIEHNMNLSRVLKLQTTDLLSGIDQAPTYLLNALNYAERSGNIILIIDNISTVFLSADDQIRNIILKFMQSNRINVIGIDNLEGYHAGVKQFPIIDNLFETVQMEEASYEETLNVLMMTSFDLEKSYSVQITFQALKAVMTFAERYVSKGGFPGKAVDILVDATSVAVSEQNPFVLESHIRSVVSTRTNINIRQMEDQDREVLLALEQKLESEIKGQSEGLKALSNALKRAKLDVHAKDKPIGTFLFLGSTGVGKTETAKALAKHYFGSSDRMIRLDMNEYGEAESVYGILGAPVGKEGASEGFLSKRVQERPFSLILLDEIEKAHKNVLNVFLQILDEGMMIDNRGMKTDFRNTIIIATSNAGALFLRDFVRNHDTFDRAEFREQLIDEIIHSGQFTPEFVNRFTEVIVYYPLQPADVVDIAYKMIENMVEHFESDRGVQLMIDDDAVAYIAEKGYSMDFGARELERTITDTLQTYLADYFLIHNVSRGDAVHVTKNDLLKVSE